MDTVGDPELASEMVSLLGRELKVARKRIEELEREPQALNHRLEELEQEIAELQRHSAVIEEAHKVDIERTRAAEFALSALKLDVTKKGPKNRVSTQTFQKEDIKLKLEDKVKEEQKDSVVDLVEKRVELENELAEAKEKYRKQRDAKRTLRQTFAEQQATLEQLSKEKETLLYQVKDLQEWQDAATGMKTRLEQAESQKEALQQNESSPVERIRILECDLDKMKEKYRAQKEAKSNLRQECGELEARLKTTDDEKAALERQMRAQEDPRQLYLTTEAQLQELEAEKSDLALQHTAQATKIESLEKKLRKLKETKKSQCEANVSLQEKLDELERQLKELTQENETLLRHLVQESQRAARDHSAMSLASILKSRHMFYNSKEFNQFLNHLPIPAVRPDYRFLLPIGARDTKISLYLARDPSLLPYSQTYIRFSEVVRWDSSKCHAVAFGPLSPHDGDQGSYFSNLHGQTRELFFEFEKQLYYAGTYRCLPTKGWSGEGALLPPEMRVEGILDQVGTDATTDPRQLSKMYRDGSLRVDCIVLQCVDFNHALYNRFLQYFEEFVRRKRQLLHAAQATPRKRQKMVE